MLVSSLAVAAAEAGSLKVQLGPRPYYLVGAMQEGPLKQRLAACADMEMTPRRFSIGHRGAALQFPEHTRQSYEAAARMGAGIIECDVTFTRDAQLVCRHAQCDLHTTTNILETELAAKCAEPFTPAQFHPATGARIRAAGARCCASDLTLAEFKSLKGKMDASNPDVVTVQQYLGGTAAFRTDLYATGATLVSHAESIALIDALGAGFTPELKAVRHGFGDSGLDRQRYARKMIQEYIEAGIAPERVWPQSFSRDDVLQWIAEFPGFGGQAVFLDGRKPATLASSPPEVEDFAALKRAGINIIAPPLPVLLAVGEGGRIVPSDYARNARQAGLDLVTWTVERSGRLVEDVQARGGDYFYQGLHEALRGDGDVFTILDVLAREVGVRGVFSDWPATTTYYATCMAIP